MCGIGGSLTPGVGPRVDGADLRRILRLLRHRGPDDLQIWSDGRCGLCHARLAVIDPSVRGRQPMASRDGRFLICYNGEVYNFRELRDDLRRDGERFDTGTDTEVVLRLFELEGERCAERLEGMFAFAVYDRKRAVLHLFRDRLGIKPLFYVIDERGFFFASEPKAIPLTSGHAVPGAERLAEFVAFRNLAGEESLLPDVRTLPPGHYARTDGSEVSVVRWDRRTFSATSDSTAATIAEAVQRQLVSDVPVGVFLSGGCDSALVCDAASSRLPNLDAFTVGFEDPAWDESSRARWVAEQTRAEWHRVGLDPQGYDALIEEAIWHLDSPLNHAHTPHLLALSRTARRRVTVALTGEGADEVFGGYPRYRLHRLARMLAWVPEPIQRSLMRTFGPEWSRWKRLLNEADADPARAAAGNAAFVPITDAARLVGLSDPEAIFVKRCNMYQDAKAAGRDHLEALLDIETQTYLVSLLQRMDRMSMAAGLECRVPLLDERVVAHARGLPIAQRLGLLDTKKPIRAAAARRFGRAYAHAPKSGFGVPVGAWMRGDGMLATRLSALLADRRTAERGWLDVDLARVWLEEHRMGLRDRTEVLWGVLNLELWARVCLDGDAPRHTRRLGREFPEIGFVEVAAGATPAP